MGLRRYTERGDQNAAASDITILGLTSAATIRPHLYHITFGSDAAPADQAFNMELGRYTAAGTATAFTPIAHDPGNPAALAAAGSNHTAEPTYTASAILFEFPVNQQATFVWQTDPEYGFVMPATAANGAGLYFADISGGTANCRCTFFHAE
jgi:hypothetical protein